MRYRWAKGMEFQRVLLDVERAACRRCGKPLHVCAHRSHRIHTLKGPVELLCRLAHCSDITCPERGRTESPIAEMSYALPRWVVGWDVFCWMGHRRFARHWSVSQLQAELRDAYRIGLSFDTILAYLGRYQTMVAARQQDPDQLTKAYSDISQLVLSIDGLQPEKGHEALYVVRELNAKRVWFAQALLSSACDEVRQLLIRTRQIAERLGKPVKLWVSDKQDAFVKGIALEFKGVPHRYCQNHFLRDLAKPMLAQDSHLKVQMRKKVRGLRQIEREVLKRRRSGAEGQPAKGIKENDEARPALQAPPAEQQETKAPSGRRAKGPTGGAKAAKTKGPGESEQAGRVVLGYCACVRGILNDDQGGPLSPPGLRMAKALREARESLGRVLALNKPGRAHGQLERLAGCIDRGLEAVQEGQEQVQEQVEAIGAVQATLEESQGPPSARKGRYERLRKRYEKEGGETYDRLSKVMKSWQAGLFLAVRGRRGETFSVDNLELERWFRQPKGHERRIHGHKHAGVRIVSQGPTLLLVLDAHQGRSGPFTKEELLPYRDAQPPPDQLDALQRHKIMRQARSSKKDLLYSQS
jgi:hypothetical protein